MERGDQEQVQKKEKPTHDTKYEAFHATHWFLIFEAYEQCTRFMPTERPLIAEIQELFEKNNFFPHCQDIPLNVSQTTAVAPYDQSAILAGGELKEPHEIPNDATNACAFLCLLISDRLYRDEDSVWSEDCWKKTTSVVEEIIITSPGSFNRLRDVSKFYDPLGAYQLLRKGGLISNYTLTEEMVEQQRVYSQQGRRALMDAVTSLQRGDGRPRIALYTCGGYIVLVGCRAGEFFVIDTHPISPELGGDGNGVIKVLPCGDRNSVKGLCTWLWKRLQASGVDKAKKQSFAIMESDLR